MNESINKKIEVLTQKAKEEKDKKSEKIKKQSTVPNSLADHIKTEEQAKSFMILLKSL